MFCGKFRLLMFINIKILDKSFSGVNFATSSDKNSSKETKI